MQHSQRTFWLDNNEDQYTCFYRVALSLHGICCHYVFVCLSVRCKPVMYQKWLNVESQKQCHSFLMPKMTDAMVQDGVVVTANH